MPAGSADPRPGIFSDTWASRLAPMLADVWREARHVIHRANRLSADEDVFFLSSEMHIGDPAQRADRLIHQFAADELRRLVKGVQVLGEEEDLVSIYLDRDLFKYIAYIDAIDGSAQAWSLPGAWGHVVVLQEYVGRGAAADGTPVVKLEPRFVAVLDAEGGTTTGEAAMPFVTVDIIDQLGTDLEEADQEYEHGVELEITGRTVVLVGGYKSNWWPRFSELRAALARVLPQVHVFNTAGAPAVRKVIQNSDNVIVQLTASTLWDGVAAALIARAGGHVIVIGETEPRNNDEVWNWWRQFAYEINPESSRWRPATPIPAFVAGMNLGRVVAVATICRNL